MNRQFTTDMLKAGDTFVVRGKTSYPKLTRVIEGEELQEEIKRSTQQGRVPITNPHSYTTLTDASIEFANPNQPTTAELYAQERLFQNKDGKICYSAIRKSQTLAEYGIVDPNDYTKIHQIYLDPDRMLASGLEVKCYFRIFDTKAGMHKGVSLDSVIFQEPVRYYEFSNTESQLSARGLTWEAAEGPAPQRSYQPAQNITQPANQNFGMNPPYGNSNAMQNNQTGQTQPGNYQNQAAPAYPQNQASNNAPAYSGVQNGYVQQPQQQTNGYPMNQQNTPAPGNYQAQPSNAGFNGSQYQQPQQQQYQQNMQNAYPAQNVAQNYGQAPIQNPDPYAGNVPQPNGQPMQTIGNAGGSAFSEPYDY